MRHLMWIMLGFLATGVVEDQVAEGAKKKNVAAALPKTPLGLEDWTATAPQDNPVTLEKWTLGQMLFWDKRLSPTGTHSCETCHHPEKGWTDGLRVSKKPDGTENTRHSPPLYNVAYNTSYYWDGRSPTLEKQIAAAWDGQLGAKGKREELTEKIVGIPGYREAFQSAYGSSPITSDHVVKALATFLRSLLSGNSAYDRFDHGEKKALSPSAQKGWELFRSKARCGSCHAGFAFTDWQFHNMGIGMKDANPDPGRGKFDPEPKFQGAFKTPTLRSVARHPPYGHLGNAKSLEAVLDYFENPNDNPHLDPQLKQNGTLGIKLTKVEKRQVIDFLRSLTGKGDPLVARKPKLP